MKDAMTPRTRPLSITIVGWWLLISGILQSLTFLAYANPVLRDMWSAQGLNVGVVVVWSTVSGLGNAAAGFGILRGARWGRTIYFVFGLLGVVAGAAVFGATLAMSLLAVIIFGLFVWFLTRPEAEEYFSGTWKPADQDRALHDALRSVRSREQNSSELQRVFGVFFAAGAGFLILMAAYSSGLFLSEGPLAVLMAGFFLVPGLISLTIAVFLQGRRRWAGVVGWTMGGVGLLTALSGISLMMMLDTEYWQAVSSEMEGEILITRQGAVVLSLIGILLLLAGTGLVLRQRSRDVSAAAGE